MSEPTMPPAVQAGFDYAQTFTRAVIEATRGAPGEDVLQIWAGLLSGLAGSMTAIVGVEAANAVVQTLQGLPDRVSRPQLSVVRGGRTDE